VVGILRFVVVDTSVLVITTTKIDSYLTCFCAKIIFFYFWTRSACTKQWSVYCYFESFHDYCKKVFISVLLEKNGVSVVCLCAFVFVRNPIGRTGMHGRGLLGRWGPNHAADPVVTRYFAGSVCVYCNHTSILQYFCGVCSVRNCQSPCFPWTFPVFFSLKRESRTSPRIG